MKNEFILHIKHHDVKKQDKLFKDLLEQEALSASLVYEKIYKKSNEAYYRIRMAPSALIRLKKSLDKLSDYEYVELFEFREW